MKFNNIFLRGIPNMLLLAALLAVTLSPQAHAHGLGTAKLAEAAAAVAEQKAQANELTQQLGNLIADYKSANASEKSNLAGHIAGMAEERWQLLGSLIETDPAGVLNQALSDDVLDQLPAKAQAFLEQRLEMEGELQLLHVDYTDDSQSHYVYLLTTDDGEQFSLHFAKELPDVLSGERVQARGLALYGIKTRDAGETDGAVAVDDEEGDLVLLEAGRGKNNGSGNGSGGSTSTPPTNLPDTLGAQETLVILVNFYDDMSEPYTLGTAQNLVFGTEGSTVSNFFLENSYQQTWLSGDVVGWFTINVSASVCDTGAIATEANNAASQVVNLSDYARLVYAFPSNACGWGGLSTVGGSPSQSWINGNLEIRIWSHELGHGLGLWHSHKLNCGDTTLGTNCSTQEYGDVVDAMGGGLSSSAPHFNSFQKDRLGWLNAGVSPEITTVENDGTYTIDSYESMGTGPKALKILKSTDASTGIRTWYYLESRQATGFDAFLSTSSYVASYTNITDGVMVHIGTESNGNSSYMLDLRPDTSTKWDPALVAGQSFNDPDAGVTITTDWVTEFGAEVIVYFGSGGGDTPTNQLDMTVLTDKTTYSQGQTVSTTATVIADGVPVANASVEFAFTKSNGKVVSRTATTDSDGVATYFLQLRRNDPVGAYFVNTTATLDNGSATANVSFVVQ